MWLAELVDSGSVHVTPMDDLIEHDTDSDDCICGPTSKPIPREDGSMGWVVTHHSLDGREHSERGATSL